MKWFKHDANAVLDSKLKRLRLKYGMEGYGLYWYCLECVARNVEQHNLTFELEEDAELIAADTGIHYERVEEMMRYMVSLGLFENQGGTITCLKMRARTDEYTAKLLRTSSGECPDKLLTYSGESPSYKKRREEKRRDTGRRFTPPTLQEVTDYCKERGTGVNPQKFLDHYEANGWMRGKNKIKSWKACVRTWEGNEQKPSTEEPAI
jgi:hypothetical protein